MEREDTAINDIVELGIASAETQGVAGPTTDLQIGFRLSGLADE